MADFDVVADTHGALEQKHWLAAAEAAQNPRLSFPCANAMFQFPAPRSGIPFVARYRIALWRCIFVLLMVLCLAGSPAWQEHWLSAALRLAGIVLVSVAVLGRLWCALYISGRKTRELVTAGPYSVCRHPLYLFNLAGFVGIACLTESLTAVGLALLAFALCYPGVIRAEEQTLARLFPAFAGYRMRTPALWPRLRAYRSPLAWTVDVRAFLRNVADSGWFLLLAVAVELIDVGHARGWVGGWFLMY